MTKGEQSIFMTKHIQDVGTQILKKVKDLPKNWEGLELKQYIADYFQGDIKRYFTLKRKKDYNNDIVVNNLL